MGDHQREHVAIDIYLSDTSINTAASGVGKALEPGGFVDRYLLGRQLTADERDDIKAGLAALSNGGRLGGCGEKQGFNLFNLIVSPAYADYTLSCSIIQADGSRIELGIKTYQECRVPSRPTSTR